MGRALLLGRMNATNSVKVDDSIILVLAGAKPLANKRDEFDRGGRLRTFLSSNKCRLGISLLGTSLTAIPCCLIPSQVVGVRQNIHPSKHGGSPQGLR